MPEIYQMLHQDHEKVRKLCNQMRQKADGSEAQRRKLFEQVRQELEIHTQFEQNSFYPAVRENGGKQANKEVQTALNEHEQVTKMLDELENMDITSDGFMQRFEKLAGALEEHIQEEENDIFRDARSAMSADQANEIGEAYRTFKQEHGA